MSEHYCDCGRKMALIEAHTMQATRDGNPITIMHETWACEKNPMSPFFWGVKDNGPHTTLYNLITSDGKELEGLKP